MSLSHRKGAASSLPVICASPGDSWACRLTARVCGRRSRAHHATGCRDRGRRRIGVGLIGRWNRDHHLHRRPSVGSTTQQALSAIPERSRHEYGLSTHRTQFQPSARWRPAHRIRSGRAAVAARGGAGRSSDNASMDSFIVRAIDGAAVAAPVATPYVPYAHGSVIVSFVAVLSDRFLMVWTPSGRGVRCSWSAMARHNFRRDTLDDHGAPRRDVSRTPADSRHPIS